MSSVIKRSFITLGIFLGLTICTGNTVHAENTVQNQTRDQEYADLTAAFAAAEKGITKLAEKTLPKALKKGKALTLPVIKGVDVYYVTLSGSGNTKVVLKTVNPSFDKNELKGITLSKDAGMSAKKVSANSLPSSLTSCVSMKDNVITIGTIPSGERLISGFWIVGKTPISKVGVTTKVNSGKVKVNAVVNSDGTLTLAPDSENADKGSIKLTYVLNRQKYKAVIKVI